MSVTLKAIWTDPFYSRWTWGREDAADGTVTRYVVLGRLMLRASKGEH